MTFCLGPYGTKFIWHGGLLSVWAGLPHLPTLTLIVADNLCMNETRTRASSNEHPSVTTLCSYIGVQQYDREPVVVLSVEAHASDQTIFPISKSIELLITVLLRNRAICDSGSTLNSTMLQVTISLLHAGPPQLKIGWICGSSTALKSICIDALCVAVIRH